VVTNDMTSVSNVVKIYHLFLKINSGGGADTETRRKVCAVICILSLIQGESLARGPKLLSIKNDVIEIMT